MSGRRGTRSKQLFERALELIPGGVNSPVRAFRAVGGDPPFVARGAGSRVWDVDGNEYVDYVGSWGPLILGHARTEIVEAICEAARDGTSFGAPTEREVLFAEAVRAAFPSMQMLRCVSSGTEATMSALRVARGFTRRDKVVKIDGGYHGHADLLLAQAGSGVATFGIAGSAGVPAGAVKDTLVVPWNDPEAMRRIFAANRDEIAAVIVEPIPGNIGVVPPAPGYLAELRDLTRVEGALLIFDEVITGFRVAPGGAQALYGVTPDLTCLGKIVGGGLPAACFGGRADVMSVLAPGGPVYQAGTLSGNPLAMAAGLVAMKLLAEPGAYQRLEVLTGRLAVGLQHGAHQAGVPLVVNRVGSMMTAFFCKNPVTDYATAKHADAARYARWFRAMLERGFYFAPSQFEAAFVSLAHTEEEIDRTIAAAAEAVAAAATSSA